MDILFLWIFIICVRFMCEKVSNFFYYWYFNSRDRIVLKLRWIKILLMKIFILVVFEDNNDYF